MAVRRDIEGFGYKVQGSGCKQSGVWGRGVEV